MTKKSKNIDKDHRPFRFQSLNERLNNININVVHRIRYHDDLTDLSIKSDGIQSSHLHQSLEHWSTLNFSEAFSKLHQQLIPLATSLEQVVYNREQIITYLRQSLHEQNPLIIETLLDLLVQLARDLQGDFYIYYKEYLFVDIVNLLLHLNKQQQSEMNTDLLEQVFQCLTYLFKYLWRIMLKDLGNLYELYSKYLFASSSSTNNTEYIRSFAAESFAYLLRKIENYQSLIDYLFNRTNLPEDEYESLALVFAETCKNVQSTFHSCTKPLLSTLLKKSLEKPSILHTTLHTIYELLLHHTNKQNVAILWTSFMDIYRNLDHEQTQDYSIYRIFYEIFQLFLQSKLLNITGEFLTMVKRNSDEDFLQMHYETVWKWMQHYPMSDEMIEIYFRFLDQTTTKLFYQEVRKIFQTDFFEKLPRHFSNISWNYLIKQSDNQEEIIEYFVDYVMIQRKKFNMIFALDDTDEIIEEKIENFKGKNQFLSPDKIPAQGLQLIQTFIRSILSNLTNDQNLSTGQVWRALILLHSLPKSDLLLTNEHLHQLSSTMLSQSPSSTIALTLLELISHSHSFPTTFWYSILEKTSQSTWYLLTARISFLLVKPTVDYWEKFVQLFKRNLSSFNPSIRLLTLYILSSFLSDHHHPIFHCLACEQAPLNVYEYRSKIIHLQKLSVEFILLNKHSTSFDLPMLYLLGLLAVNFTPLWTISIELLGSYGKKAVEYIGHGYFWSILQDKFQLIKEQKSMVMTPESIPLIEKYLDNDDEKQSIDLIQYRINLFQILSNFPQECEQKTKILLPIIFDFFREEYYDHLLALGLFASHPSSYQISPITSKRLSKNFSIKTLESILNLLKQFHHSHQWFEPERLYSFYIRLLLSTDPSIQQLAYHCLLTCHQIPQSKIHSDFLSYSEAILPIFTPSTCRKTFHHLIQGVLLEENLPDSIKEQYAFVLIRIIFSKLNAKRSLGSTTRGRKDYLELNRKYLFQFLITFASKDFYQPSFHYFIQLLLEPFHQELFSSSNTNYLQIFQTKISSNDQPIQLDSYEVFLKYIQHSLLLLKTFISKLKIYIEKELDSIVKFLILTIKLVDYLSRQPDGTIEGKKIRSLLKRLRSMSYKSLQTIFQQFDHEDREIFSGNLINDLWLCCIKENYLEDLLHHNKQREDIVHLLKLTAIWTSTPILKKRLFDGRNEAKDLIECLIELLKDNISYENKQLIIEIVWNLMQMDPNDRLVDAKNEVLLDYLTQVSNSMIESKNSMSLSEKEFDILLILSNKQMKNDKIEQLSSIFFRLLRQNILSKKKGKTSEQNVNISILKVLQNLLIPIENSLEKYLHFLPILCVKILARDQRIELIQLIQTLINSPTNHKSKNLWCLQQLIELNSWNTDQVSEPDYERRLTSYKQLTERLVNLHEHHDEYLCVFYHCIYEIHYSITDLSLREYASQCLHQFVERIPSYQEEFLKEIRLILKQPNISRMIRDEFLRHLAFLVDLNLDHQDLIDLKRLRNSSDIEIDFFHNITHVQIHRRYRALKRLKIIHSNENFRVTTINHYLLPIVCSFLVDETQDMHDEIVFHCLTMFAEKLPWTKYNQLFISFFRQLTNTKRTLNLTEKRCLTKAISAIIDGFHETPDERITRAIQQRLLPMILDLLSQNSFSIDGLTNSTVANVEDQRQQAVLLTITCSLIATKLLVIFPHEYLEQHISTILLHLITLLRSRLYSIRDQARDCLCKCITILGKRYLKYLLEELIGGLQRGYQHFVLLHTIHCILIHISSLTVDFNIDSIVKTVVNLFVDDFFNLEKTESSKANEHENSSYKPSSIPEAKTNKTTNVFELLGRLIRSNEQLFQCIEPLRQQLSSNHDAKQISRCEKCLQRFQTGLLQNPHLSMETFFTFIYHLLTKTEEQFSEQSVNEKSMKKKDEQSTYLIPLEPKRGHARVAQAIKHVKKTNIHCLIAWTLNFLHKMIKKYKTEDEKFLSMIDPFLIHIEGCLNSPYIDVIVASLRNLSSILEYSFPSLTKDRVTNMYKKVFYLLKTYSSVAGSNDMNDLLTLCYKILGIFVQRSMVDDVRLTTEEYQYLFNYIESDFLNLHRQSSAFLLLRSIMRHSVSIISNEKSLRTQLDNLLRSRVIFLLVQSPIDHVRSTCRELFHLYLFSYEHTKHKLKSYFDFILLQLDYEEFHGRLSVLIFLQTLFQDLTKQRLNDYAAYFFVPLACHYYNETNQDCKKNFQENLRVLLEKIDQQHRDDILKNIVLAWKTDRMEHRCLALQLFILFIQIEREQFDQYLPEIFQFLHEQFNEIQWENHDEEEQERFQDQYIYHLINVLIYVMKFCPSAIQMLTLRSKWLDLLKIIDEKCLLHPHIWVRLISTQTFGLLFENNKADEVVQSLNRYQKNLTSTNENGRNPKRMKKSMLDQDPLFIHYITTFESPSIKIQRLSLCSCSQLKPSGITEEFSLQITKNLLYLSKLLLQLNSPLIDLVIRRCSRLTTFESTKHPNEITRRSAVLKFMAALVLELSSSITPHLKSFLTIIERELERDETTTNLPLKALAQDVFDVLKRHCDIHVITSLYAEIAKERRVKRSERKQKLAILAINQPDVIYRKKRAKQTKRVGLGKKKRMKAIENAKKNRRKKVIKKTTEDMDEF